MERGRHDDLQWSLMENPFLSSSHLSESLNHLHLTPPPPPPPENHPFLWQNHHLPQNSISTPSQTTQNRLYQNPNSQNHLLLPDNHHHHHLNYPINIASSLASGLPLNPSFAEPLQNHHHQLQSLETALSRMNLSSTQNNSLMNRGFSHLSFPQQQPLNRMRSMSASLGLLRAANSTVLVDRHHLAAAAASQVAANQSFSNFGSSNRINLHQRRSPSYDFEYSTTSRANIGGSRSQFSRVRSVNGLDNSNSNSSALLSSLYNRQHLAGKHNNNNFCSTYSSLEQVKGRVVMVARDQEGCRFLQKKIDEQIPEQTEIIFLEVKDHLCDLIVDQFANYLIQKLFGTCNEEQMSQLLISLIKNEQRLLDICIHPHGTRSVQKMIEHIRNPEQISALISALKNITVSLSKNHNGHHVIQQCFKYFMVDDTKYLLDEIAKSCLEIAMDKSGCCVLQKSVTQAHGELKERLVAEITNNALVLSEHPYGNYVVQYVLEMNIPHAEANILERLRGNYVTLSMNKYGSNVVEKCLKECNEKNASGIIEELMHSPDFLDVLQDPFGNYVVQSALLVSKGDLHHALVSLINIYYPYLHSHLHGKKVLARTRGNRNRV